MHNSLTGWWWGNRVLFRESQSSTWFQHIWDLPAGGQHAVDFLHLVGGLVSAKQLKDVAQDIISSSWGGTKGPPWLCFMAKLLFLSCLTVFLCFCIFSLIWLNLLFGTQGRPRRLKLFYKQEVRDTRWVGEVCPQEGLRVSHSVSRVWLKGQERRLPGFKFPVLSLLCCLTLRKLLKFFTYQCSHL